MPVKLFCWSRFAGRAWVWAGGRLFTAFMETCSSLGERGCEAGWLWRLSVRFLPLSLSIYHCKGDIYNHRTLYIKGGCLLFPFAEIMMLRVVDCCYLWWQPYLHGSDSCSRSQRYPVLRELTTAPTVARQAGKQILRGDRVLHQMCCLLYSPLPKYWREYWREILGVRRNEILKIRSDKNQMPPALPRQLLVGTIFVHDQLLNSVGCGAQLFCTTEILH